MTDRAIKAESAVAGSILLDHACLPAVMEILTSDDFYVSANKSIFESAVALHRRGDAVDPVTIKAESAGAVSDEYMLQLMDVTSTAANADVYAIETRRESMRRALQNLALDIDDRARLDDPREIIGDAMRELERIESQDTSKELASTSDALMGFFEYRSGIECNEVGFAPTGFKRLDKLLGGGLLNGGLYVMAARPGMGKTAFALTVADGIARRGPVLFVSLEMDKEQITARRLGRMSGISATKLLMGKLDDAERSKLVDASELLSLLPMEINRKPRATVDDIGNMARKVNGLRCIVVDYFGLIKPTGNRGSRYEDMTEISAALKAMARTMKVPVICLAQLNRENMGRTGKRPQLSDLRDTGALEQDADGVIFLHRPDYYEEKTDDEQSDWAPVELQIILEKNRHGGTGMCRAIFEMQEGRILPADGLVDGG